MIKKNVGRKEKNLFIGLGKDDDIQIIIKEYLKKSGLKEEDFHFATGFVQHIFSGDTKEMEQLLYLLQTYFYAGVYYGKTSKKLSFGYVTQKERAEKTKEIKQQLDKLIKGEIDKSYMG